MYWGHYGFHPFFGFLFFILILGVFFSVRFFFWRKYRINGCSHGGEGAFSLLQKRLVNGEITEEEYIRLKDVLKK